MPAEYYYVTQHTDQAGYHLLHRAGCITMPARNSLVFIGSLYNSLQALTVARVRFGDNVKACYFCCLSHHEKGGRFSHPLPPVQRRPSGRVTE